MTLNHITILNYKNIKEAELDFSPNINCFVGTNGEGKTNVLDAIYFLSFTKSATNAIDSQNVRHGEEFFMIQGQYELNGNKEEVSCGLKLHQKKQFKRNKKAYTKLSEHIGLLPLILVSPNDHELILGGSDERRKFMDIVISQYNPSYINLLMRHNAALQQRNTLLKQEEEPDVEIMNAYEEVMASCGEQIFKLRNKFITDFIPVFQDYYARISGNHEKVGLEYISHCQRGPLLEVIQRDRAKDRIMGYSLHGIHKDDLVMTLGDYPIKREGSQGQNKTYLISLKLAQFNFLKQTGSKTTPLLLLDDIFDKLDANRVEQIINLASDEAFGQLFITDTNRENLDRILERSQGDYKIFTVEGGVING
ncbi:MAG: DNA replication and repair protein RecF [Bacteroidaceae bacterium]|nr:DNA replication and repair protein RecF [Bacteroidaceae bacterium]